VAVRPITASGDRARASAQQADRGLDREWRVATARMVGPPWKIDATNRRSSLATSECPSKGRETTGRALVVNALS
jgi:hypothetical protein